MSLSLPWIRTFCDSTRDAQSTRICPPSLYDPLPQELDEPHGTDCQEDHEEDQREVDRLKHAVSLGAVLFDAKSRTPKGSDP